MSFKVVIPARYASERLPGKPLLDILGKPMVVRVAEQALKKINRALKNNVLQSPEYQQSQHTWLKTTFTDFDKHYQQQVINFYLLSTDAQVNTDH